MPYKDPNKQKEANRLAAKRSRERHKGMTEVIPDQPAGCVIPKTDKEILAHWAEGHGTPYQVQLGILSRKYDVIKGY